MTLIEYLYPILMFGIQVFAVIVCSLGGAIIAVKILAILWEFLFDWEKKKKNDISAIRKYLL